MCKEEEEVPLRNWPALGKEGEEEEVPLWYWPAVGKEEEEEEEVPLRNWPAVGKEEEEVPLQYWPAVGKEEVSLQSWPAVSDMHDEKLYSPTVSEKKTMDSEEENVLYWNWPAITWNNIDDAEK